MLLFNLFLYFQAEELNTIIGNAFKMAYAKEKTQQPTFNELIEQQLVVQKAKFEEYQEQASRALQKRLNEIATPTAMQRMEMRRQSSSDELISNPATPSTSDRDLAVGKNKVWVSEFFVIFYFFKYILKYGFVSTIKMTLKCAKV